MKEVTISISEDELNTLKKCVEIIDVYTADADQFITIATLYGRLKIEFDLQKKRQS